MTDLYIHGWEQKRIIKKYWKIASLSAMFKGLPWVESFWEWFYLFPANNDNIFTKYKRFRLKYYSIKIDYIISQFWKIMIITALAIALLNWLNIALMLYVHEWIYDLGVDVVSAAHRAHDGS